MRAITDMSKTKHAALPQKYFGRFREPLVKLPSLVESQIASFTQFVEGGAERVFKEFSPISDHSGKKFELELVKFTFGDLRWDEQYAKRMMKTYEAPLSMVVRLKNKTKRVCARSITIVAATHNLRIKGRLTR